MPETQDETQPVKVTLRDIYEVVVRLDRANAHNRLTDHEERIRALEKQVWAWAGGAALAGGLFGQVFSLFLKG
jgi:hypothetical protein